MEIVTTSNKDTVNKPAIEQVVKQKMEYTLLGTYGLKRGMKLFAYDYSKQTVEEVIIKRGNYLVCELTTEGWVVYDPENFNVTIDSKLDYFQSPSITIANNLVKKLKEGKIQTLFNLKPPSTGIDLFSYLKT